MKKGIGKGAGRNVENSEGRKGGDLLFILHPLMPISNPRSTSLCISSMVPVKLCTSPRLGNSSKRAPSNRSKSSAAARECRNNGNCTSTAMESWASKYLSC